MSNKKLSLEERIDIGERLLRTHEKALEAASMRVTEIINFVGGDTDEARKFAPDAFELVGKEDQRVRDIKQRLDRLRDELDALKS